jgi:acyl-coenzyme A synthetase/AMP-(fatty) acid ligase
VATLSVGDLRLPAGLRVHAVVADANALLANPFNLPVITADLTWTEGNDRPVEEKFISRGGDDIARIVLTSGSTGVPKAIAVSHEMEMRRIERFVFVFANPFPECSKFFSDMGFGSGLSFRLLLYVLSRGGTFFFPGATAMDTLQTFNLYGVEGMLASPGGLSGVLKFYETNPAFHSGFKVIISAGSPLHKSLSERVRARLSSNLIFFYGTSETATVASAPAHMVAEIPGAVGHVMPGVSVEIVDAGQKLLPPGSEGVIRIRSATTVAGYFGDTEQAGTSFQDGYFRTGDLGYLTPDGVLVISGREKDVLNLGGEKIRPEMVEEVLAGFKAVAQVAVLAMPNNLGVDELWLLIVSSSPLDSRALRSYCEARLPPSCWPTQILTVDRLPRNENGKIERHRLRDVAMAAQG